MTIIKTKLAKAVTTAIAGAALSAGAVSTASAHTMYNTAIRSGADRVSGTDGWVYNGVGNPTYPIATPGWVGTGTGISNVLPFTDALQPYVGTSHLNWAAELHAVGNSLEISKADALARYGTLISDAEIDTGAGAWQDAGVDANGNLTANGPTGWKHQTDIGLIMAEEDMYVTLKPSVVTGTGYDIQNFGITVFTGMDTNTGTYNHHGAWNCPGCLTGTPPVPAPKPYEASNPFGTQGVTYLTHDGTVDATNGLSFLATANQVYSIYLGGAGVGRWNANVADYKLDITTSPVPLPAAVWLFGGALMGFLGLQKRKMTA